MGVVGILISLGLLMWLAYRGITVLVLAPLLALLAVLFDGDVRLLGIYTQVFMTALGGFLVKFFPVFLLGAIFGRLMADSGAAETIARAIVSKLGSSRAMLAVVLACGVLTYGGVSVFVVAFAAFPVAARLFRQANLPKRLIPGAIVLGAGTLTMTALPGSPSIQNAIPMPYFGTDLYAAPVVGIVAGILMLSGGLLWLNYRRRKAIATGEGYGVHANENGGEKSSGPAPGLLLSLVPLLLVVVMNYVFTRLVIPAMDTSYLAEPRFGGVAVGDVRGMWALIAALAIACVAAIALYGNLRRNLRQSINQGTMSSLLPIFNTASEVGYGTVIASLAAFALIRDKLVALWPGQPLLTEAVAINAMAGITGSASGGLGIALAAMGETFVDMAAAVGISPELLHRVAVIASGGLDSLPHNGAVITLLVICGLTHRESYADIFVVSVVVPVLSLAAILIAGATLGLF
jgi:H+/gluconate symporter-like permease